MADSDGILMSRITIERRLNDDDDIVDQVTTEDNNGDDIPLTEALGMLRMAEDTLLHPEANDG